MKVYEYVGNPHVHTPYSDGTALHAEVAQAAERAGLDFVIITDHNVWVNNCERYYGKTLLLVGEEIHDVRRTPPANHLLAYHAESELAPLASDPQTLIGEVNKRGGFCYLAHPFEYGGRISPDLKPIPWANWEVTGYTGLEIWNYMSEFKALLRSKLSALYYAYFPSHGISGPFLVTLHHWDRLLAQGQRVAAIGGADAHGNSYSLGPLNRVVFPYEYLFRCVNTHILTDRPLNGTVEHDKTLIYDAIRAGRTWVGYDLLAPTTGFRFYARSINKEAILGAELARVGATRFEVQTPAMGEIRLLHNGRVVARTKGRQLQHTTVEPGAYRVEVYRGHRGRRRGWIFSSPIYVT
ncbi:MAG: CehA/McbA family metallohydrolase [Anaerolineae bacterium]|nr:CehA/McbA family metallohydrolase [Anaerolineae bacterium]